VKYSVPSPPIAGDEICKAKDVHAGGERSRILRSRSEAPWQFTPNPRAARFTEGPAGHTAPAAHGDRIMPANPFTSVLARSLRVLGGVAAIAAGALAFAQSPPPVSMPAVESA
jgi:hypothetical protein